MSDLLIKGMEMPTKENAIILITPSGDVWMIGDMPNEDTYLVEAKAVPVPPHGDLIDKDATMNAILEERGEDTSCWFAGIVNDMPAVIPSDKTEEGER